MHKLGSFRSINSRRIKRSSMHLGGKAVSKSVLDAIQSGQWDYEPEKQSDSEFSSTKALPGSDEKLKILAARIREGLPLWHPSDRHTYDDQASE